MQKHFHTHFIRLYACLERGLLLSTALFLTACGSSLSGEYTDEMGIMSYEFKSDGKVYMTTMGIQVAGEYEIDKEKIIVEGPHGNMVFERKEDQLVGPMGLLLTKKEK